MAKYVGLSLWHNNNDVEDDGDDFGRLPMDCNDERRWWWIFDKKKNAFLNFASSFLSINSTDDDDDAKRAKNVEQNISQLEHAPWQTRKRFTNEKEPNYFLW